MKTDFFDYPRSISKIEGCFLMGPEANCPYRVEKSRSSYGLSYHISTETEGRYEGQKQYVHRQARTLAFIPKYAKYETRTTQIGYSACINFQLAQEKEIPVPRIPFWIEIKDHTMIEKLIVRSAVLWQQKNPGYQYECMACLCSLLAYLEKELKPVYLPMGQISYLEGAISYINEYFASSEISVELLAKKAGVSPAYFRKKFKEYMGMTPTEYIRMRRIDWAKELITSSMFTMESIALQSGFADSSHFCREFRRSTGLTPTEYRLQMPR